MENEQEIENEPCAELCTWWPDLGVSVEKIQPKLEQQRMEITGTEQQLVWC